MTTSPLWASDPFQSGCFVYHFKSAIGTYTVRKEQYAAVTQGRSDRLFNTILWNQLAAKPLAWAFDLWARSYQKAGIPVLCRDFVDMADAPAFIESDTQPWPVKSEFYKVDLENIKKAYNQALDHDDYAAVHRLSLDEIEKLNRQPKLNCLYRHFVESLGRMSYLAPGYVAQAKEKSLSSPATLLRWAMKLHVLFFEKALKLDEDAMSLQAVGVPIICRDVPKIPMEPSF